jgi:hypothetical protein
MTDRVKSRASWYRLSRRFAACAALLLFCSSAAPSACCAACSSDLSVSAQASPAAVNADVRAAGISSRQCHRSNATSSDPATFENNSGTACATVPCLRPQPVFSPRAIQDVALVLPVSSVAGSCVTSRCAALFSTIPERPSATVFTLRV